MPELPEVETIKRVIEPQIQGLTIEQASVRRPEVTAHPAAEEFCRRLAGQVIAEMARRGKFLMIQLHSGSRIILHLRMTGCLLLAPASLPEEMHTHIVFALSNGMELRFSDTRRFGRFWLLEQTVVAGIGNIYSDEILFTAGIDPARTADSLRRREWERLAAVIPERLAYFIEKNAITAEDYLQTKGRDYRNTPFLQVYGQEGKPCPRCGQLLLRTVIGGRSSVYCLNCQKP